MAVRVRLRAWSEEMRAVHRRLRPDLAPVITQLVQDHHMIEHLIGALQRAMEQGATTEEKTRHLDSIKAVMENHFRYEERRLLDDLRTLGDETVSTTDLFGLWPDQTRPEPS